MKQRATTYRRIAIWLGGVGVLAFALSLFAYWFTLRDLGLSPDSSDWGTFGDFVGGFAGTVIALATLVAIAITLQLQAAELQETRQQLMSQAEALDRENAEATFFRLLSNRHENIESLVVGEAGRLGLNQLARIVAGQINALNAGDDRPRVSQA